MRSTTRLTAVAGVAALLLLTGCSDRPDKADTVGGPAVTSSVTPTAEPSAAPVVEVKSLTQDQINAALLTQADMPAGWTQDTSTDAPAEEDSAAPAEDETYAPPECKAIVEDLSSGESEKTPVAEGKVSFGTAEFQFLAENIQTWESDLNQAALESLTAALSACPSYTTTAADGTVSQYTISALDMPNYGDRTLAVRLAIVGDAGMLGTLSFTLDVVVVASGNVSVSLVAGGFTPVDPAVLQQITSTAMAKVNAAT